MRRRIYFLTTFVLFTIMACDPMDPDPTNESEIITTVVYTLTPQNGGDIVTLLFEDLDGNGNAAPTITGGTLQKGKVYNAELKLFNNTTTPVTNITEEVKDEALDHQFFFQPSNQIKDFLKITYDDTDSNSNPIGLKTKVTCLEKGTGTLKITLRHLPNKTGTNVKSGDITNAGGETDLEVEFPVGVQ